MRHSQRKKRKILIIFLFAVLLFMFAGFYYFSSEINIKGVGGADNNFQVLITDVSLKEMTGFNEDKSKVPTFSDNKIEFRPFLNNVGESLTYDVTVENRGFLDAKINFEATLDEKNPGVKFDLDDIEKWGVIKAGDSLELSVKLYYDSAYSGQSSGSLSNLILTLESVQSVSNRGNDNILEKTHIDVPKFFEDGSELKIVYPRGCGSKYVCSYLKDSDSEVIVKEDSIIVPFNSSGVVTAKVKQGNTSVSSSHNIMINPIMKIWHENSSDDFHSDIYKNKISYVEFLDNVNVPKGAKKWDVSYNNDGSVIAYVLDDGNSGYKLYIGGKGGVISKDLSYIFYGFSNLKDVNLSKLNTVNTLSMKSFFEDCNSLTSLDLKSFNTRNVIVMKNMFKNAVNLKTIYVSSGFSVNQVISSKDMFYGCNSLIGQSGTAYSDINTDKWYATVDLVGHHGYFSQG